MITISEIVAYNQPAVYGALVTWPGKEYIVARQRILGRLKFSMLKRLMEEVPKPSPKIICERCKG